MQLLKPQQVHRDGELVLDNDVLDLSDEDTYFDRLTLKLSKAPKYGNLFEMMQLQQEQLALNTTEMENTTTTTISPSVSRRKIVEGEEIPASLIIQGRLKYVYNLKIYFERYSLSKLL